MRFPILGRFSQFFNAHTFATLLTAFLNGGMVSLGKGAYRWLLIGIPNNSNVHLVRPPMGGAGYTEAP
jgi:hypothetical protein